MHPGLSCADCYWRTVSIPPRHFTSTETGYLPYAFARLGMELRCPFRTMRPDARALLVIGHGPNAIKTKPFRPAKGFVAWYEGSRTAKRSLPPIVAWAGRQAFSCHLNPHPNGSFRSKALSGTHPSASKV